MPLENAIPIRLSPETLKALKGLSKETKVSRSALLRLAVTAGLPLLAKKIGSEKPQTKKGGAA